MKKSPRKRRKQIWNNRRSFTRIF